MHNSRKGFTLAEVLITLSIIGVVAALTIPSLISSTTSSQYQTAFKKSVSTLNQALTFVRANGGTLESGVTSSAVLTGILDDNLNIITSNNGVIWLADGSKMAIILGSGDATTNTACSAMPANNVIATAAALQDECYAIIDVNGDKEPNTISTAAALADVYVVGITPTSVVPIDLGEALVEAPIEFDSQTAAMTYTTGTPDDAAILALTQD
jgi:prepilin-type N-terminal cleavage/methylation domain-containing protein